MVTFFFMVSGRDFIVLSENNRLLFNGSEEDYDETVAINVNLFNK